MAQAIPRERAVPTDATVAPPTLRILARWLLRALRKPSGNVTRCESSPRSDAQNRLDSLPDSEALLLPEVPRRPCKPKRNIRG